MNIEEIFEKYHDEFLNFNDIEEKRSNRPDLHAFLVLDSLVPGNIDMVLAAEHDEIFLDVSPDRLSKVATEDQIRDLIRCGVRLDVDTDSLCMFA